jgi:MFS family permease
VASGLVHAPLFVPYVAWTFAGLGMGIAYPTVYLATMDRARRGGEGATVALMLLIDSLGVAVGTGLGGSAIALTGAMGVSLTSGLWATFLLALVAALLLAVVAGRLDRAGRFTPSAA